MSQPATVGALRLICKKCRRYEDFPAENRSVAAIQAQGKGWEFKLEGGEICPRCVNGAPSGQTQKSRKRRR